MNPIARKRDMAELLRAAGVQYAAAFGGACAERLRPLCARMPADAPEQVADHGLTILWRSLELEGDHDVGQLKQVMDACRNAIPGEGVKSVYGLPTACVEDFLAATHYALRAICQPDPEHGMRAAGRVWDLADYKVQQLAPGGFLTAEVRSAIEDHPLVVDELARQDRDLRDIVEWARSGEDIRAHAFTLRQRSRAVAKQFVFDLVDRKWPTLMGHA